jgi:hypothetical protein
MIRDDQGHPRNPDRSELPTLRDRPAPRRVCAPERTGVATFVSDERKREPGAPEKVIVDEESFIPLDVEGTGK